MKRIYILIATILTAVLLIGTVNFVFAAEERDLTNDEKEAFIVRDEWTGWVKEFTASLSELDKEATAKIYENMDFYDMQYRFTEKYKKVPEYLDEDGKPTQLLKDMIKEKRIELNRKRLKMKSNSSGSGVASASQTDWMSKIPDERYINDINIPGIYDPLSKYYLPDNTSNEGKKRSYIAKAQDTEVVDQLNAGYRAFDIGIRYFPDANKFVMRLNLYDNSILHKTPLGSGYTQLSVGDIDEDHRNVEALLDIFKDWLDAHPTESIVLCVRYAKYNSSENETTPLSYEYGGSAITPVKGSSSFGTYNKLYEVLTSDKYKDYFYIGTKIPKLKDVRKKVVLLVRDYYELGDDYVKNEFGIRLKKESNNPSTDPEVPFVNYLDTPISQILHNDNVDIYPVVNYAENTFPYDPSVGGVETQTAYKNMSNEALVSYKIEILNNAFSELQKRNAGAYDGKMGPHMGLVLCGIYLLDGRHAYSTASPLEATTGYYGFSYSDTSPLINNFIKSYDFKKGKLLGILMLTYGDEELARHIYETNP